MSLAIPTSTHLMPELSFTTARSSGPGGQNVNKTNTKVMVRWDIAQSGLLNEDQKAILLRKLAHRITKDGSLILASQLHRSQLANKEEVIQKLDQLLIKAFTSKKKRKPTKPGKGAIQKRLEAKKQRAEKKSWRRKL